MSPLSGRTIPLPAGPKACHELLIAKILKVENEFHLPDVTVTRVKAIP